MYPKEPTRKLFGNFSWMSCFLFWMLRWPEKTKKKMIHKCNRIYKKKRTKCWQNWFHKNRQLDIWFLFYYFLLYSTRGQKKLSGGRIAKNKRLKTLLTEFTFNHFFHFFHSNSKISISTNFIDSFGFFFPNNWSFSTKRCQYLKSFDLLSQTRQYRFRNFLKISIQNSYLSIGDVLNLNANFRFNTELSFLVCGAFSIT